MSHQGKILFSMTCVAGPDAAAEGKRLLASHAEWVARTHHREGELELLSYNNTQAPEFSNALDPSSAPTGNTIFMICEVYQNPEGLADHWKQAMESWADFGAMMNWATQNNARALHGPAIEHALW